VSGDASVTGSLSVNGTDITVAIAEQSAKIDDHIGNINTATAPHMTVAEHEQFNKIAQLFADMPPDNSHLGYTSAALPPEAIPPNYFPVLYKEKAQDNWPSTVAPGNVFGSRVPLAYTDATGTVVNTYSSVAEAVDAGDPLYTTTDGGVLVTDKLWDNAGLQHTCSTDTVENRDDYTGMGPTLTGRKWAFYWEYGNYVKDQYGIKHVTTIRGVPAGISIQKSETETFTTSAFDITQNTCAFGPVFWFACVEDKKADMILDVAGNPTPIAQLWIISDSPWDTIDSTSSLYDGIEYPGLSNENKAELQLHGITADDWHIWPECLVKDADGNDKIRPYWCHSAFALGLKSGTEELCSIAQLPLKGALGFQYLNELAVNENGTTWAISNCPGSASVNGFGMLFDIVKNSTKDSQSIHSGFVSFPQGTLAATANYDNTDGRHDNLDYFLFPADANISTLQPGLSRRLSTTNISFETGNATSSYTLQHVRVKTVGKYDLATGLPSDTGTTCIVIDKATDTDNPVKPFVVYTTANLPSPLPENTYVCCYACASLSMAGETMLGGEGGVLYKHDGAVYSFMQSANGGTGTHTYRVQGTEYSPGCAICAADTVAVKGNGSTTVTINGVDYTPTSSQYVILQSQIGKTRYVTGQNATITNWTANDVYVPISIVPAVGGTVLNEALSYTGVAYPTRTNGINNAQPIGTRDGLEVGGNPAMFQTGGRAYFSTNRGSAYLSIGDPITGRGWGITARD
jgi:hypothetical protein